MTRRSKGKTFTRLLSSTIALIGVSACSTQAIHGVPRGYGDGPEDPNAKEEKELPVEGRPAFQLKSVSQLRSSLDACVGDAAARLVVTASMRQVPENDCTAASPGCKVLPPSFMVGDDALEGHRIEIDGTANLSKQGTRPDELTLTSVTAVQNIANVVAVNCVSAGDPRCACGTDAAAEAMVKRCLPNIALTAPGYADAVSSFAATCRAGSLGQAKAIASLLASYAFMKAN